MGPNEVSLLVFFFSYLAANLWDRLIYYIIKHQKTHLHFVLLNLILKWRTLQLDFVRTYNFQQILRTCTCAHVFTAHMGNSEVSAGLLPTLRRGIPLVRL